MMITVANGTASRPEIRITRQLRRVVKRNRWIILGAPVLTLLAALAFVATTTPVYDGVASIRIDEERSGLAALDALQQLSTGSQISTEAAELRTSRSLVEDVVAALSLHAQVNEPKRATRSSLFSRIVATREAPPASYQFQRVNPTTFRVTGGGRSEQVSIGETLRLPGVELVLAAGAGSQQVIDLRVVSFPLAVRTIRRKLPVSRPDREATILDVRYESTDRELAQVVPNEVTRQFIARRDAVRKTQARSTVVFLAEQNDTLARQLQRAEAGLLSFREGQRVISPEVEAETRVTQLVEMQAERDVTDAERRSLASIMSDVEPGNTTGTNSPSRRLLGFPTFLAIPAAGELLGSLTTLENERAAMLRQYKETEPAVINITRRIRELDNELLQLSTTYLKGLSNKVAFLDATLAGFRNELDRIPAKEIQLARLRRQAKVLDDIYVALQTRLQEAQIAAAVADPSVRVIDPAVFPLKPIRPNRPLSVALALVLGLALGFGIAFGREHLDNTIRNREELQEASGAIPVLGMVPRFEVPAARRGVFPTARNGGVAADTARMGSRENYGPVAEAYRILRTNIAFTRTDVPAKVIVVTSALPGEGKSTSARNLAITLARQELRVALLDGDLRRGNGHQSFGVPREPGLSSVLLGRTAVAEALHPVQLESAFLHFMPTGPLPPNPAELLASPRAQQLLDDLKLAFDAIIIDTPPLNLVTDAAIIGSRADGVLVLARAGVTDRDAYRYAIEQLLGVHARVLGCVLNDVDTSAEGQYGRDGSAYYAPRAAT